MDRKLTAFWHFQRETYFVLTHYLSFWTGRESGGSPVSGNMLTRHIEVRVGACPAQGGGMGSGTRRAHGTESSRQQGGCTSTVLPPKC